MYLHGNTSNRLEGYNYTELGLSIGTELLAKVWDCALLISMVVEMLKDSSFLWVFTKSSRLE